MITQRALQYIYSRERKGWIWRWVRRIVNRKRLELMDREKDYYCSVEVSKDGLRWKEKKYFIRKSKAVRDYDIEKTLNLAASIDSKYKRITIEV